MVSGEKTIREYKKFYSLARKFRRNGETNCPCLFSNRGKCSWACGCTRVTFVQSVQCKRIQEILQLVEKITAKWGKNVPHILTNRESLLEHVDALAQVPLWSGCDDFITTEIGSPLVSELDATGALSGARVMPMRHGVFLGTLRFIGLYKKVLYTTM